MRDAAPAASSAGAQASEDTKPLLQVFEIEAAAAYELTAIQAGVDVQNKEQYQQWAQGQITTRQQVLDTIRAYHTGVIRTEMRQLVFQIEGVVKKLNDAVLRQHDNLRWLTTESRQEQKRMCALQVLLNGFDTQMPAEERLFMINWIFEQIDYFRSYLKLRGFNLDNPESSYVFLCCRETRLLLPVVRRTAPSLSLLLKAGTCVRISCKHLGAPWARPSGGTTRPV